MKKVRTQKLRSSISLDDKGNEHVWAEFSEDSSVVTVRHTKFGKNLCKPVEVPIEILSEVCYVLKDANQYLKPKLDMQRKR